MSDRSPFFVILGWCVAVAFLAAGVPLFLRMPLWSDATLYDVAARTVLAGGVHYRDVFDTNPPGFVWLLCGVRAVLGPSPEAVRAVDLVIVVVVVGMLLTLAHRAGATHAGIAWAAAAAAAFYPFLPEFNHAQRDVWMMLPAVAAIWLRVRRCETTTRPTILSSLTEGLLWGLGCWIKPQLLFVAAGVWLVSAGRLGPPRRVLLDFAAVFAGGVVAGLTGLGWLIVSGTWPHFLDVWVNWNTVYAAVVRQELPFRLLVQLDYFPPYSGFALLAGPLAAWNLHDRRSPDPARFHRAVLSSAYLAWLITTLLLQRAYPYAHVPETLLMLAVFAANRWPVPVLVVLLQLATGAWLLVADPCFDHRQARETNWVFRHVVEPHPALDLQRMQWWAGCFEGNPPRQLRRGIGRGTNHFGGHDPVELGAVADFLRQQHLQDGELIAWHDSPHALYLELGIKPSFRFMHVGTASGFGPWQREQLLNELQAALPGARFAVSDLYRITAHRTGLAEATADGLPPVLPDWQRREFPFDQPVVFCSPGGRYRVHRITHPVMSCVIPAKLDQTEPNPGR